MGEILHNLGHTLGMLDEQQRPDATGNYHGHGPYLRVFWQNVPYPWRPVLTPREAAYTGSAYDGEGDAFWGYAPYDFDSIMHLPPNLHGSPIYETIPASKIGAVGQRSQLSHADVLQLLDSYRCRQASTTTTTTTQTTVASSTTTTPRAVQGCTQNRDCAVNPWCNDPNYQEWCPQQHSVCPAPYCVNDDGR